MSPWKNESDLEPHVFASSHCSNLGNSSGTHVPCGGEGMGGSNACYADFIYYELEFSLLDGKELNAQIYAICEYNMFQ